MKLPTAEEIDVLLHDYRLPENIISHIMKVRDVAVFLAKSLREKDIDINLDLVRCGALLHDIARPIDFKSLSGQEESIVRFWSKIKEGNPKVGHNTYAYNLFQEQYPELATIIRRHVYSSIIDDAPITWEEKIVNYADKRVLHDRIVTLKMRFLDGLERWKANHGEPDTERLERINNKHLEIEKEIFMHLDFEPEELEGVMNGKGLL